VAADAAASWHARAHCSPGGLVTGRQDHPNRLSRIVRTRWRSD